MSLLRKLQFLLLCLLFVSNCFLSSPIVANLPIIVYLSDQNTNLLLSSKINDSQDLFTSTEEPVATTNSSYYCENYKNEVELQNGVDLQNGETSWQVDVNDQQIQNLVTLGLEEYIRIERKSERLFLVNITEGNVEVALTANLYKLKVKFAAANCSQEVMENCQLFPNAEMEECFITANCQFEPWINNRNPEISVFCDVNKEDYEDL